MIKYFPPLYIPGIIIVGGTAGAVVAVLVVIVVIAAAAVYCRKRWRFKYKNGKPFWGTILKN